MAWILKPQRRQLIEVSLKFNEFFRFFFFIATGECGCIHAVPI